MENTNNARKTWEKPAVQMLNINKDTYGLGNKKGFEKGKGSGENQRKRNS